MEKLQELNLISKVCKELENHLNISDKTLAEFIIHLAKESVATKDFMEKVAENGAELTPALAEHLLRIVKTMTAARTKSLGGSSKQGSNFSGLSKPNTKPRFEADEHLDDHDIAGVHESKERATGVNHSENNRRDERDRYRRRSRSRSRERRSHHNDRHRRQDDSADHKRYRRDNSERSSGRDHSRSQHREATLYEIYDGRVSSIMDFGCFVELFGVVGKKEGLVHITNMTTGKITEVRQVVQRGDNVKVKVISMAGSRMSLSMKDVDQKTGKDLIPLRSRRDEGKSRGESDRVEKWINPSAPGMASSAHGHDKLPQRSRKRMSSPERWEAQQLINSGVLSVADYPTFDDEHGLVRIEDREEEFELELNDEEPTFLKGQTKASRELSPVRIVKNPDGSMQRAAMTQSSLAKERRELRRTQANEAADSAPKDLNGPWEDPMPESGGRNLAIESRSRNMGSSAEVPEWKRKAQGKNVSYGQVSTKSIIQQREGLPIFKLKHELMSAISSNQVLVVIGETGSGTQYSCLHYHCSHRHV